MACGVGHKLYMYLYCEFLRKLQSAYSAVITLNYNLRQQVSDMLFVDCRYLLKKVIDAILVR